MSRKCKYHTQFILWLTPPFPPKKRGQYNMVQRLNLVRLLRAMVQFFYAQVRRAGRAYILKLETYAFCAMLQEGTIRGVRERELVGVVSGSGSGAGRRGGGAPDGARPEVEEMRKRSAFFLFGIWILHFCLYPQTNRGAFSILHIHKT